jgi:HPt (histidine-containing phosphotransfer) domain-containing protein
MFSPLPEHREILNFDVFFKKENRNLMNIEQKAASLGIDKDEYSQLLKIFINTSKKELSFIKEALQIRNFSEAARLLHSVKGAAVSLGLANFAASTQMIEENLTISSTDSLLDQVQVLISDLGSLKI